MAGRDVKRVGIARGRIFTLAGLSFFLAFVQVVFSANCVHFTSEMFTFRIVAPAKLLTARPGRICVSCIPELTTATRVPLSTPSAVHRRLRI